MARKYTRDNRGRFASSGGGATARGGRLKTAAGNKRATQTMSAKGAGAPAGTIAKGGNGVRGSVARSLAATRKPAAAPAKAAPKVTAPKRIQAAKPASSVARPADYTGKPGPRARRVANSIKKGNLVRTTDADQKRLTQNRATAERALKEVRANPPRNAFGLDRNAIMMAESRVKGLQGRLPAYRKPNRSAEVAANRDGMAIRRSQKQNDKIVAEFRARVAAPKPAAPAQAKAAPKAPAIQASGRTRAEAAKAQKARNKRVADYAEFSVSLNPRVSRNSRVTEEGRYAERAGRPVIARRKYSQPNIFGGTDRVAGSSRAKLVGTRERGQSGVIPLAARALPIKGRGKPKPRPYGSR